MSREVKHLIAELCTHLNVLMDDVISRKRKGGILEARQICVYEIKHKYPELSLQEIGKNFGKKPNGSAHSFVLHSIKKVERMRKENPVFKFRHDGAKTITSFINEYNYHPQY